MRPLWLSPTLSFGCQRRLDATPRTAKFVHAFGSLGDTLYQPTNFYSYVYSQVAMVRGTAPKSAQTYIQEYELWASDCPLASTRCSGATVNKWRKVRENYNQTSDILRCLKFAPKYNSNNVFLKIVHVTKTESFNEMIMLIQVDLECGNFESSQFNINAPIFIGSQFLQFIFL